MVPINPTDNFILTLSDLRRLGRQGGATLILDYGRQAIVKASLLSLFIRNGNQGTWLKKKKLFLFTRFILR